MPPKKTLLSNSTNGTAVKTSQTSNRSVPTKKSQSVNRKVTTTFQKKSIPATTTTVIGKKPTKKGVKISKSRGDSTKNTKNRTENHIAATKIQCMVRCFLARNKVKSLKTQKLEYEKLMDDLQKQAFVEIVRRQREEDEKQRQKETEERQRKREETNWRKSILESAFDGELDKIKETIKTAENKLRNSSKLDTTSLEKYICTYKEKLIDCADANENSVLSEASAGGDVETVEYLLQNGADVNSQGHYKRTPIYRASFGGHLDAVKVLLKYGADPRILDNDGMLAEQIAALPEIALYISNWNINKTEEILKKLNAERESKEAADMEYQKMLKEKIQQSLADIEKEYESKHKVLQHGHSELSKRIYEHDSCIASGFDKTEVTLQAIHDAEEIVRRAQGEEKQCREKLDEMRLQLRLQTNEGESDHKYIKCHIKELNDVLFRDVGDKIRESNRWPMLIDISAQAATFLKYSNTNYIHLLNPRDVETESLRLALLGAIRYGKPLVLDMMEVNMMSFLHERFDDIQKDLFQQVVNKEILREERYLSLLRSNDGPEYSKDNFIVHRVEQFKLVLVTKMWNILEDWNNMFYVIKIIIPEPK